VQIDAWDDRDAWKQAASSYLIWLPLRETENIYKVFLDSTAVRRIKSAFSPIKLKSKPRERLIIESGILQINLDIP